MTTPIAEEILQGHKTSVEKPNLVYKVAPACIGETDPETQNRAWLNVIDAYIKRSAAGTTRLRLKTAKKDKSLQKILRLNVLQDRPRQSGLFFEALNAGGVSCHRDAAVTPREVVVQASTEMGARCCVAAAEQSQQASVLGMEDFVHCSGTLRREPCRHSTAVIPVALQLYTVRNALADDPIRTLRRVREAGYGFVETAPPTPNLPTPRLARLLQDEGLSVVAAHCDLPLGDRQEPVLDDAEMLGTRRIIWHGWPKEPACESIPGFENLLERYLAAFDVTRKRGLRFGLHNHWWEFETVEGESLWYWLDRRLPGEIFFELDVYWARTAGSNPVEVLTDLGERVRMVHLKDGPAIHGRPMTALGEGAVDIRAILEAAPWVGAWVVELDECASDPLRAAEESLTFLRRLEGFPKH